MILHKLQHERNTHERLPIAKICPCMPQFWWMHVQVLTLWNETDWLASPLYGLVHKGGIQSLRLVQHLHIARKLQENCCNGIHQKLSVTSMKFAQRSQRRPCLRPNWGFISRQQRSSYEIAAQVLNQVHALHIAIRLCASAQQTLQVVLKGLQAPSRELPRKTELWWGSPSLTCQISNCLISRSIELPHSCGRFLEVPGELRFRSWGTP